MSGTLGYCHVRKEDLRSGSARDVNPPFASFDVVVRRDYDAAVAEREALRERLGCAIEELERRHPLDADPLTAAIIRDGRAALERPS